ncbi:MAG: hypothetical protein Q7Q73_06550 [Verrucomicrobiota bacterium JB024]|nr:hypothetical protein [Verrucomicrobiota bacterium JB024]
MKTRHLLSFGCLTLGAGLLHAGESVTEDFESYPEGTSVVSAGWKYFSGQGSIDDAMVGSPSAAANPSARVLTGSADGRDLQMTKPFGAPWAYTGANNKIEYRVKVVPQATGSGVQPISFGVATDSGKVLPLFGVCANPESRQECRFQVNETESGELFPAGHLYELWLTIDTDKGLPNARATLKMRDLSAGQKEWTTVPGLEEVKFYLEGAWNPRAWKGWYIRSSYRREVDDLSLSAS